MKNPASVRQVDEKKASLQSLRSVVHLSPSLSLSCLTEGSLALPIAGDRETGEALFQSGDFFLHLGPSVENGTVPIDANYVLMETALTPTRFQPTNTHREKERE